MSNQNTKITRELGTFFEETNLHLSLNDHTLRYLRSLTQEQVITMHRLIQDCPVLSKGINTQIVKAFKSKSGTADDKTAKMELHNMYVAALQTRQKEIKKRANKAVSGGSSKQPQKKAKTDEQPVVDDDGKNGEQDQRAIKAGKRMQDVLENSRYGEKVDSDNEDDSCDDEDVDSDNEDDSGDDEEVDSDNEDDSGDDEDADSGNEDDNTHDSYSEDSIKKDASAMVMNADNANEDTEDDGVEPVPVMSFERAAHDDASESTTSDSAQVREPPVQALGNGSSGANLPDVIVIDDD